MREAGVAEPAAVLSATRLLAQLQAQPSNRSCADCRVTLVDASQVYVSLSPAGEQAAAQPRYNHFLANHEQFAPPGASAIPRVADPPVDPALLATCRTGGHGVFCCAMCGAAHKLLGSATCVVHAVQDTTVWTDDSVARLTAAGGNTRATRVLEAYWQQREACQRQWPRPRSTSSIAHRLTFIRAKYQALAFVLPPAVGPLAPEAWRGIVARHDEWKGLWGADLTTRFASIAVREPSDRFVHVDRNAQLPRRLVDHFCVVDHSTRLDPSFAARMDPKRIHRPEDVLLAPVVTECFPGRTAHADTDFPEHLGVFCCPEGYRPSSTPHAPAFFTFVLTCSDGNRLYGGALTIYDQSSGLEVLRQSFRNSGCAEEKWPSWLLTPSSSKSFGSASDVIYLPKCLVVLSHYPFFDIWKKFLLGIYRIALVQAPLPLERFVANFCSEVPVPPPGRVQVRFGFTTNEIWTLERPPENVLPMANFSFRPLFASLSVANVMVVIGCLLQETRVALVSRHYALLTPVAEALVSLLFPFRWQGLYIPIMPYSLLDILDSPVPFLLGMHSRYLKEIPKGQRPQGVVFVDLDKDIVHLGMDDETHSGPRGTPSLPEKDAMKLKTKLDMFAAPAYLLPDNGRVGGITHGTEGTPLPYADKDLYAQGSPNVTSSRARRRELFENVDKAYTENELVQPMAGFLSEHGQYHDGGEATPATTERQGRARIRGMLRIRKRQSSLDSQASDNGSSDGINDILPQESLLELHDVRGFSTEEVRNAFLRFFVSIMRHYGEYMEEEDFNTDGFLSALGLSGRNRQLVSTLTQTQLFQRFLQERRESPNDPECIFFDESINAKLNRSKLKTLANIGRGGRRDTRFIDDKSKKTMDIYTPPPPSNLGLPDDGRTYQYGSFPELNPALFGKLRPPREWPARETVSTIRTLRRKSVVPMFGLGVRPTAKAVTRVVSRGTRTLDGAITFLSRPFVAPSENKDKAELQSSFATRRDTGMSDLTLPSELDWTTEDMSSAEEVVLNARRKASILLAILVVLQAVSRGYLCRRPREPSVIVESRSFVLDDGEKEALGRRQATEKIRDLLLIYQARRLFLESRGATILIQSVIRGRRCALIFALIRHTTAKLQALVRQRLTRGRVQRLLQARMQFYAPQMFALWKMAYTPLAYRTKFWPYLHTANLMCHGLVETELQRLVKELNLQSDENRLLENGDFIKLVLESEHLGMSSRILKQCAIVDEHSTGAGDAASSMIRESFSSQSDHVTTAAAAGPTLDPVLSTMTAGTRVASERTQIYERLSDGSIHPDISQSFYESFGVPLKDKRRKVALTDLVWAQYKFVNASVSLMLRLFPELVYASDLHFQKLSKKGLRRIRSSDQLPDPLAPARWAHTFLERRLRENVLAVATLLLQRQGATGGVGRPWSSSAWQLAVTGSASSWPERRLELMQSLVTSRPTLTASRPAPKVKAKRQAKEIVSFPDLL